MSKRRIEYYLPKALTALPGERGFWKVPNSTIHKVYEGYTSSFGVSLYNMGLLPTLAIYASEKSRDEGTGRGSERSKKPLINILTSMVSTSIPDIASQGSLLGYAHHIDGNYEKKRRLKYELVQASIALKLAIRTYKLEKEEAP